MLAGFLQSETTATVDEEQDLSSFEHLVITPRETPRGQSDSDQQPGDPEIRRDAAGTTSGQPSEIQTSMQNKYAQLKERLSVFHSLSGVDNSEVRGVWSLLGCVFAKFGRSKVQQSVCVCLKIVCDRKCIVWGFVCREQNIRLLFSDMAGKPLSKGRFCPYV